jgi:hypothetical protein
MFYEYTKNLKDISQTDATTRVICFFRISNGGIADIFTVFAKVCVFVT